MPSETVMTAGVKHTLKRYTKFVVVGTSNALVDLAVLNLFMLLIPNHTSIVLVAENTVAVTCAIVNSYVLNRHWTFADASDGSRREFWMFVGQGVVNIALNDWILALCASYLVFSRDIPIFVSNNASKALAMFLSSSMSYFLMKGIVFRGTRKP